MTRDMFSLATARSARLVLVAFFIQGLVSCERLPSPAPPLSPAVRDEARRLDGQPERPDAEIVR